MCEFREGLDSATNNVAEYRALILDLKGALERGMYRVRAQGDSKLVCEQVCSDPFQSYLSRFVIKVCQKRYFFRLRADLVERQ